MKISILDAATLGADINYKMIEELGETEIYDKTAPEQVADRISDSEVVIINKIKLNETNLKHAQKLKLICVAATGYDNIDIKFCQENNIAVCNVVGYSAVSVSQLTVAMALSLVCHLSWYDRYSKSGAYTRSGVQNKLEPVYYELEGKTWGIIGMGNIGKRVKAVAEALGCRVLYTRQSEDAEKSDLDTILRESHIISVHTPLNESTYRMIGEEQLNKCTKKPILINVARGGVFDEEAVCNALLEGKLSGLGVDVYSVEPFPEDHPYNKLSERDDCILTPHMAWGAYESRIRCLNEIAENIKSFNEGKRKGRIV